MGSNNQLGSHICRIATCQCARLTGEIHAWPGQGNVDWKILRLCKELHSSSQFGYVFKNCQLGDNSLGGLHQKCHNAKDTCKNLSKLSFLNSHVLTVDDSNPIGKST